MKSTLLFLSFWLVISCTPKPGTIKLSNYQYGLELTKSLHLINNLIPIGQFCLENNEESNEEQLLTPISKSKVYTHYKYELSEVISWLNNLNNCDNDSPIIHLDYISSNTKNYHGFSFHKYRTFIALNANYFCHKEIRKYSSQTTQELIKHKFLYGEKKNQAMMSATIILAFHAAISDIYNQINKQCN